MPFKIQIITRPQFGAKKLYSTFTLGTATTIPVVHTLERNSNPSYPHLGVQHFFQSSTLGSATPKINFKKCSPSTLGLQQS